jgi:hypothetical protein
MQFNLLNSILLMSCSLLQLCPALQPMAIAVNITFRCQKSVTEVNDGNAWIPIIKWNSARLESDNSERCMGGTKKMQDIYQRSSGKLYIRTGTDTGGHPVIYLSSTKKGGYNKNYLLVQFKRGEHFKEIKTFKELLSPLSIDSEAIELSGGREYISHVNGEIVVDLSAIFREKFISPKH